MILFVVCTFKTGCVIPCYSTCNLDTFVFNDHTLGETFTCSLLQYFQKGSHQKTGLEFCCLELRTQLSTETMPQITDF